MCSTIRATFRQSALAASASSRRRYVIMCCSSYTVSAASVGAYRRHRDREAASAFGILRELQTGLRTRAARQTIAKILSRGCHIPSELATARCTASTAGVADQHHPFALFRGQKYDSHFLECATYLTTRVLSHLEPAFGLQAFEGR
jgi:hypothetical protein